MKIKVNDNLTSLFNYINDSDKHVGWFELVQFAIDYKMYEELYINQSILDRLIQQHNNQIDLGVWHKPN